MKTWEDATYEDVMIEVAPGVTIENTEMINKLNWTSWLRNMGDLVDMDESNVFELTTREHFDTVLLCDQLEYIRAVTGSYPDSEKYPDLMNNYMDGDHMRQMKEYLTQTTIRLTKENWPEFRDKICEEVGLDPKDFHFEFEDK